MKEINKIMLLAALVFLSVACSRSEIDSNSELSEGLERVCLTFSKSDFVNADGTKTAMTGNSMVWESGDKIAVYITGGFYTSRYDLTLVEEDAGKSSGRFEGDVATDIVKYDYCAVYPAEAAQARASATLFLMALPTVQEYKENGIASGANISTLLLPKTSFDTRYKSKALNFSNSMGILNLNISGTAKVSRIVLVANGSTSSLSGIVGLTVSKFNNGGNLTVMVAPGNKITLDCSKNGGVQLTPEGVDFNILLPPGTLTKGFSVTVFDVEGLAYVKKSGKSSNNAIERSVITKMPQFTYEGAFSRVFIETTYPCMVSNCTSKSASISKSFVSDGNQTSFDGSDFFIHNMAKNFVVKFALPSSLTIGTSYDVVVSHVIGSSSDSGISNGTLHLKYVGSDDVYARFVDEALNVGYTFNCQL